MSERKQSYELPPSISYHENLAQRWSALYDTKSFNRRRIFLSAHLRPLVKKGARWLDAGCGSGILTRELNKLGASGLALDGSPGMIANAISEAGNNGTSFEYRQVATIESLGEGDASCDGVLCSSVVEYIRVPKQAFSEFFRVLKPGGVLLVSVPCRYSPLRITQKIFRRMGLTFGRNLFDYLLVSRHEFSASEIRRLLVQHGFVVDSIDAFDPLLPKWLLVIVPGSLMVVKARKPVVT